MAYRRGSEKYQLKIIPVFLRLSTWFWFGLTISLLPIGLAVWKLGQNNMTWNDNLKNVICHGELLLVCTSLLGTSMAELIKEDTEWKNLRITIIGFSFIVSLFTMYAYSEASTISMQATMNIDKAYIYGTSLYTLLGAILSGCASLVLPKKRELV